MKVYLVQKLNGCLRDAITHERENYLLYLEAWKFVNYLKESNLELYTQHCLLLGSFCIPPEQLLYRPICETQMESLHASLFLASP